METKSSIEDFYHAEVEPTLNQDALALAIHLDCYYDDAVTHIDNEDYFVLTDEEATERARIWAEDCADEAIREIPRYLQDYFDSEAYISDIMEDRGSLLASYDGEEYTNPSPDGTLYYIYRIN